MQNPQLAETIIQMTEIDQKVRNGASGNFSKANYNVRDTDALHGIRIHQIIQEHGYPTQELIGAEGMIAFWLLIQHQDFDSKLQEDCLTHCDFNPENNAYLTDRVRVNNNQPQLYGTQFMRGEGKLIPKPIEDEEHVDERRKEVGLDTLEEYAKRMNTNR